jgi:hypothetical protein
MMQPLISQALVAARIADMRRQAELTEWGLGRRPTRRQRRRLARDGAAAAATCGPPAPHHA